MFDPDALRKRKDLDDVGAVMVVSAFGSPVDTARRGTTFYRRNRHSGAHRWRRFVRYGCQHLESRHPRRSPIMISLHATKVFGTGEGGLLLSTDVDLSVASIKSATSAYWDSPAGQILGYNGKLSEYNAAVGLAMLETLAARRERVKRLTERYRKLLAAVRGRHRRCRDMARAGYRATATSPSSSPPPASSTISPRAASRRAAGGRAACTCKKRISDFPRDPLPVTEASRMRGFSDYRSFTILDDAQLHRTIDGLKAALL